MQRGAPSHFSETEDEIILGNWEKCEGNPKKLAKLLTGRTKSQLEQHIKRSKKFNEKLHEYGFSSKKEKVENDFFDLVDKRRNSDAITFNSKMQMSPNCL